MRSLRCSVCSTTQGGTVYIYGGTLNATGGTYGTGIGGSKGSHGANVYIYGGDVTATGGEYAASFGAGYGIANDGSLTLGDTMVLKVGQETPDTKMTPEEYYPIGHRYAHVAPCFEFVSKSLALDSAFAFNFYGKLYDENPAEDAYVEFKIGDIRTVNVALKDAVEDNGRLKFTCLLNVLELDEKIEAIFHDGEATVERDNPLSVTDYLDAVLKNHKSGTAEDAKVIDLIDAISNYAHYAHYAQIALDETHDEYTVGDGGTYHGTAARTAITQRSAEELKAFAAEKSVADGFADITSTSRSLVLDDETAIVVYLTPADGEYVPTVAVIDEDGDTVDYTCELQQNGKYKIVIRGIAAHMLTDNYTVRIDNGKLTYSNLSALSYAYSTLAGGKSEAYKNAVSTLYDYYTAAIAYKN